ncbi:MAG: GWxTD domain-containing protein, partial [Thermoanaerobaculia bacterium]
MRNALLLLLALTFAWPSFAADEPPPLTRRERKDLIAKLPEKHRQFLADVEPIIIDTERDTFLRLETDAQRDTFIDDFWRRRDLARGTTNFSARDEYLAQLDFVKENFGNTSSDRGRIYLIHGPPTRIMDIRCERYFQPTQVWYYEYFPGFGHDFRILFYIPRFQSEYRLWNPIGDPGRAMQDLVSNDIQSQGRLPDNVVMDCEQGEHLAAAMAQMRLDSLRLTKLFEPPPVNGEDVNRILRSVVLADPKAPKLEAQLAVAYPYGDTNKTDAQITIMVPRAQLKTTAAGDTQVYTLDVTGEVLRDGKMWEKYRYRFDYPATLQEEKVAVVIDRLLKPAEYLSRIKISDPATNAEAVIETPLVVPEVNIAKAATTEEGKVVEALQNDLQSTRAVLRIVPLRDEVNGGVISGVQTIQTLVSGGGIKSVEFWLDGKKIATRRSPPYKLDLDFGTMPRSRRVRVVAIDS